ncbi:MAG: hypothetical protein ACRCZB_05560 [Bacteroidales bacterium]
MEKFYNLIEDLKYLIEKSEEDQSNSGEVQTLKFESYAEIGGAKLIEAEAKEILKTINEQLDNYEITDLSVKVITESKDVITGIPEEELSITVSYKTKDSEENTHNIIDGSIVSRGIVCPHCRKVLEEIEVEGKTFNTLKAMSEMFEDSGIVVCPNCEKKFTVMSDYFFETTKYED